MMNILKKEKLYNIIILNNYIKYKYHIKKEFEAGILLKGWQVKALRKKNVTINNSYVFFKKNEVFLCNFIIKPFFKVLYSNLNCYYKLLLNRFEINYLFCYYNRPGYTIVVLSVYLKHFLIKIKIGIVKSKNKLDKRVIIKNREWEIDKMRLIKKYC